MGIVVQLTLPNHDHDLDMAFETYVEALHRAQASGRLRDMIAAVRAYEAWLVVMIPDPAERREVWP